MSNTILYILIGVSILALCFSVFSIIKTKITINKLNKMIDDAITGDFKEKNYDESEVSKLTLKLSHYFSHGRNSIKKIEKDRNNIKSMISDISHQTKTPIANILMYANLLSESSDLTDADKQLVNEINSQSSKLNFLIQALINASRLETGILQLEPITNRADVLINTVKTEFQEKAADKDIQVIVIENEMNSEEQTAIFDMKWTVEAIGNIVDNAIKYSPANTQIKLSTTPYEQFLRIDIEDQGIGMSEDEHAKIYARFWRSQNVSEKEGVGIGLYVTREIISTQNGYIKLTSQPGQGSIFSVFLPRH